MREVTDPGLLDKLNGVVAQGTGLKEVTDPNVLAQLNTQSQPATAQVTAPDSQDKGTFSSITQPIADFIASQRQRGADLNNAVNATSTAPTGSQQTPGETAAQFLLHNVVGGVIGDPLVAGAKIAGNMAADITPQPVKNVISSGARAVAQSPVGQAAGNIVDAYKQNEATYNAQNPRAARNFQAIKELTNVLPLGSAEVRGAADAATDAASSALKNLGKGVVDAVTPDTMYTSDAVKQMARTAYQTADQIGGTLSPSFADKVYDMVDAMKPQTAHGIATTGENDLAKLSDAWQPLRGKPITLEAAQEMDEGLSQKIDGHVDRVTGKLDKEGQQLYNVQTQLRTMVNNAKPSDIVGGSKDAFEALADGRNYWSTALRIGDMEKILQRASMTDNPATSIKAGFRTLANNPSRMVGYSAAEKSAINRAAQSGVIGGTLRTVLGSRLIGTTLGGAIGATGGPLGIAAGSAIGAAQSSASRAAAAAIQRGRANKVIKTLSRRVK